MVNFECCRNCDMRAVGCHSACTVYNETKAAYNESKAKADKRKRELGAYIDFEIHKGERLKR